MIRVEVATHFNEDAFSYGLARGTADRLREALRDVSCGEHDEEVWVRVSTEGVAQTANDLHIEVHGCCAPLVARVEALVARSRRPDQGIEPGGGRHDAT